MAGGAGQPTYGAWQNWVVAIFTLVVVTVLNHFAKGFLKLASILVGMIAVISSPCSSAWWLWKCGWIRHVPASSGHAFRHQL